MIHATYVTDDKPYFVGSKSDRVAANGRPVWRGGVTVTSALRRAPEWAVRGQDPNTAFDSSGAAEGRSAKAFALRRHEDAQLKSCATCEVVRQSLSSALEDFVDQEEIGEQRAQVNGCVQVIHHL